MKNILATFAVFVYFGAFGQQVNISSATAVESVVVQKMLPIGDDIVVFGWAGGDEAFVARVSPFTGDIIWSHKSPWSGPLVSAAQLPNGNFVAVGSEGPNGLVSVFTPDGTLVWSKIPYVLGSEVTFYGVTTNSAGDVFLVGRVRLDSESDDILLRLDGATGNTAFSTRVRTDASRSAIGFRGDSLFVVGSTQWNNGDISLGVYSPVDGALLFYRAIGSGSNEIFSNASFSNEGIFFTYVTQGVGVHVGKISWATLDIASPPVWISPGGGEALNSAQVSVSADGVYVSGGAIGGVRRSFAIKLTHNLAALWGRFITPSTAPTSSVFGTSSLVLPSGDVLFADLVDNPGLGTTTVITGLNSSGSTLGTYCQNPTVFDFQTLADMSFGQTVMTPAQSPVALMDIPGPFAPYGIDVENCNLSILPVELLFFRAEKIGEVVDLLWATGSEMESSHFSILRSQDGLVWGDIGSVDATGNSQHLQKYGFVDNDPLSGTSYYKLNSVDIDQTSEFSDVVFVRFDERNKDVVVYPNPAQAGEWVTVKGKFERAEAFDQSGRQVSVEQNGDQLNLKAGPGLYTLNLFDVNGVSKTVRVVTN